MKKKKEENKTNSLLDALNLINLSNPTLSNGPDKYKIVDIMTFCDSPELLNLPASNFKLWLPQRIILKSFYMGTRGNENLKLNQEEWQWLYDNINNEEREGVTYEKNIGEVIDKLQRKEKEGFNFSELHMVVGRRGTKCRSEEDRIPTTEGSLTFRELCDRLNNGEKIGICTYDPITLKRSVTYKVKAQNNGSVECFKLETKRGIQETSSWNHPYLVWRDMWSTPQFIQMSQLLPGDKIATAAKTELFGKGGVGINKAALLGHFQGDGGITHQIRYSTACPVMLKDFKRLIKTEFPEYDVKYVGEQYDYTVIKASGRQSQNGSQKNDVKEWLKDINCFGKKSIEKEVPDCIYKGTKEEVVAFLSRLFGCDGWSNTEKRVSKEHGGVPGSSIGYCSSSQKLMDGVRHLLLKFGIHAVVSESVAKCNEKKFKTWRLRIKRQECIEIFQREINIFSKEKAVRKCVVASELRSATKSEFDSIPIGVWTYISGLMESRGLSGADIIGEHGRGHNDRLRKQYAPNKDKIMAYGIQIDDSFLKNMGKSDVKWDEVKSISPVGQKQTVDLEVPETHIIGGDIISHNTILASVISAYEAYKLIKIGNGNPHRFYGIPDGEDIAIINVALSQDQAGKLFGHIESRLRYGPFFKGRVAKQTTTEIRLYTDEDLKAQLTDPNVKGSIQILCGHSDPKTLRGSGAVLILFDELAFYDESGKTPGSAFYNALEPSTKKFKKFGDGRLVEISSPNSTVGIFHDIFESAKTSNHILSYQLPTWCVNMDIPYESLAEERKRNIDNFIVEYGAQWARGGVYGKYFDDGLVDRCIIPGLVPHNRPEPGYNYYLHVDPANGGDRYVALLVGKRYYNNHAGQRRSVVSLANMWIWEPQKGIGLIFNHIDKDVIGIAKAFRVLNVSYDQWNCCGTEEYLYTKRGLLRAKEVTTDDQILSKDGTYNSVINLSTKNNVKGYEIGTKFGYSLRANDIHPVYVKDKGFVELKDLRVNDIVLLNQNPYNFGNIDDAERALLSGYLISEGYIGSKNDKAFSVGFTNTNKDVLKDFLKHAIKITGKKPIMQHRYQNHETYKDAEVYTYRDKKSMSLLVDMLGHSEDYGSAHKVVPNFVMRGNQRTVAAFLSSLYEGDGHISLNPGVLNIEYDTTSKILAQQIQLLLLGFGIKSSLKYYTNKFFKGKRFPFYRVSLYGENILIFGEKIGFRSEDKKTQMVKIISLQKSDKRQLYKRKNKGLRKKKIRQTNRSRYMFDKIVSIDPIVLDIVNLEVDGDHTYISNGIVSHNSVQSLQLLKANGVKTTCISYNRNFKMTIYQNLTDMMSHPTRPELLLYDDNRLISEMKALRKKATMRGMSLTTDKHGDVKTDDLVDCLAGAVAVASENVRPSLPLPVTCVFR